MTTQTTGAAIASTAWDNRPHVYLDMTCTRDRNSGDATLTLGDRALSIGTDYEDADADDDTQLIWGWTWTTYVRDDTQDRPPMAGWEETGTDSTQSVEAALAAIATWFAKVEMTTSPTSYRILSVEDL